MGCAGASRDDRKPVDRAFAAGVRIRFYDVIDLMKELAPDFDIDLAAVGLEKIDADRDLLFRGKASD